MGLCGSSNNEKEKVPAIVKKEESFAKGPPTFKIVLLGDKAVGKSCIVMRYTQDKFSVDTQSTIGYAFISKDLIVKKPEEEEQMIRLHIWDTAGEEAYKSMTKFFYRDSTMGVIVFDITNKKTFDNLKSWIEDFQIQCPDTPLIIIGNKSDLDENRVVLRKDIQNFVESNNYEYIECSAKSGKGITELFEQVAMNVYRLSTKEKGQLIIKTTGFK